MDKENERIILVLTKEFQMSNQRNYPYHVKTQTSLIRSFSTTLTALALLSNVSQILAYIRSWRLEEQEQDCALTLPNQNAHRTIKKFLSKFVS